MTVRDIVKNVLHEYFMSRFGLDIDIEEKENIFAGRYFDALDLVELEMDMNKHFKIELEYAFEKWESGTIKDIVDSIEDKLKEEGL